ncbi:MAG: UDP-N-acetylmuramate--alanine ligase [Alphaproteobacteria bacterium]|nr:UDP-N-acetylmuramate--alanine ligase [Alphaproteobacteria bacterium]
MGENRKYFFCGVGGSGMLPLAAILKARGAEVNGSDRSLDQGRLAAKFDYLQDLGVGLFPQDGSGLTSADQVLVASAAIEDAVPDVAAAKRIGAQRRTRAETLADLFNGAETGIGVAGTSGKSTTTAMIAWILAEAGLDPTVMNGAVMKNFVSPDAPFASARIGAGAPFVSEIDESDGSIALFRPRIAVLNNIAHDHKTMDELRRLFGEFVGKSEVAVINLDHEETARFADRRDGAALSYSIDGADADYVATDIVLGPVSVDFLAHDRRNNETAPVRLAMPGRHNVANALAAIAASVAAGAAFSDAANALGSFRGVKRRFDIVGDAGGVTVIDDFAHNPDKIAATLRAMKAFPGRILVLFQPHGFGPLRTMRSGFVEAFADGLGPDDRLWMPEPVYFGGTVDRSVSSADVVAEIADRGVRASAAATREACRGPILAAASAGDRIIVMGARDDTLSEFAADLLQGLAARPQA